MAVARSCMDVPTHPYGQRRRAIEGLERPRSGGALAALERDGASHELPPAHIPQRELRAQMTAA